jgi:hypothetical protein
MCEKADGSEDDSTQYDEYDKANNLPFRANIALKDNPAIRTAGKHDAVSTLLWRLFNGSVTFLRM